MILYLLISKTIFLKASISSIAKLDKIFLLIFILDFNNPSINLE
ncbi:hypothetical protein BAPKO_0190 [Borreliella afzelii PKo]|nr:hypothetical protein BAPKO_0190 [Borreliella afzelii PKo]